jgi:hypothetical protein
MTVFACFGLISLRLALNPTDRHIYRARPSGQNT